MLLLYDHVNFIFKYLKPRNLKLLYFIIYIYNGQWDYLFYRKQFSFCWIRIRIKDSDDIFFSVNQLL